MIPRASRIAHASDAPTTPGKRALRLWLRLLSCANMIEQQVSRQLRDRFSVTLAQFDVMSELEHAGAPITMTQLSERLMVSKGNITGLIDRLQRDKMVTRTPSEDDGRVLFIVLTERGKSQFNAMAKEHEQWLRTMFSDVDSTDQNDMIALLKQTKLSVTRYQEHS